MSGPAPRPLFRALATAEAVTWTLLLAGMAAKYTGLTELGVRVFGMVHGVVFIGYCLVAVLVAVDQRWSTARLLLGLAAAVPPLATLPFERYAEARGLLGVTWRLRTAQPRGVHEAVVARLVNRPLRGAAVGVFAVAGLTAVALVLGPPVG